MRPVPGGIFCTIDCGSPRRRTMSSTMTRRSRMTALPWLVIAPDLPSATLMNCCAVIRLASSHAFWTRGRPRALFVVVSATLRSAPVAGPASGRNRGGSARATSPWTSTLA